MVQVEKFVFNPLQVNTFILSDESKECIIIDAACYSESEKEALCDYISDNQLKPLLLLTTHGHADHILGNSFVTGKYHIPCGACALDTFLFEVSVEQGAMFGLEVERPRLPDLELTERSKIKFGNSELTVLHVPGHSPGSLAFLLPGEKKVFVGDALFYGSIGRTDLPGGNYDNLIKSITTRLLTLDDETMVYPGHGPATSIGSERRSNPFLSHRII
jgi:hydroxyacylglutathione hydrolase